MYRWVIFYVKMVNSIAYASFLSFAYILPEDSYTVITE
jgi:hypothetical protein